MKLNSEWLYGGLWVITAAFYWWVVRKEDRKFHEAIFRKPKPTHVMKVEVFDEFAVVTCSCDWSCFCEDFDSAMKLAFNHPERRS